MSAHITVINPAALLLECWPIDHGIWLVNHQYITITRPGCCAAVALIYYSSTGTGFAFDDVLQMRSFMACRVACQARLIRAEMAAVRCTLVAESLNVADGSLGCTGCESNLVGTQIRTGHNKHSEWEKVSAWETRSHVHGRVIAHQRRPCFVHKATAAADQCICMQLSCHFSSVRLPPSTDIIH